MTGFRALRPVETSPRRGPIAVPIEHVDVSTWLRGELRRRRISQRMLAARTGVDHSTISRIIAGSRDPSFATVSRLARGLGLAEIDAGGFAARRRQPKVVDRQLASDPHERSLERGLRLDPRLNDTAVEQILDLYRAVRGAAGASVGD